MFQDSHNPAHLDGVSRIVLVDGVHQKAHEDVITSEVSIPLNARWRCLTILRATAVTSFCPFGRKYRMNGSTSRLMRCGFFPTPTTGTWPLQIITMYLIRC